MDNENKENIDIVSVGLAEHTLRGEVRRVVYESPDGSYSVLRIVDEQGVEHTAVGPILGAYQGQGIEMSGLWENHKEHGRQLHVKAYRFTLPATAEGIKRYMCSGVLPGIGPKLAGCIVDTFGVKTLEVLDRYSARLREVPGLGKKRIEQIRKAWKENTTRRNIDIFLQGLGISTAYCRRIYKFYGDESAEKVKENPYCLAYDIDGIGFLMADRAAASLGIGKEDDKRLCAGVSYALDQLKQAGHTCYPEEELVAYSSEILGVSPESARKGIQEAVNRKTIFVVQYAGVKMAYCSDLYAAELELPKLVKRLNCGKYHAGQKILKIPPVKGMNFSEEQLLAVRRAGESPFSIITGGPGVGKTTVVGEIVRRAVAAKLKVYLAAPTGRAAKRLSETSGLHAMTIHRMLKWEPTEKKFIYDASNPLKCDMLIVDETSMLDITLAVSLFRAVKPGTTVIMVGDADQLPSVGPGQVLNDFICSGIFASTHLKRIFRQGEGSRIVSNAHTVNEGMMPEILRLPKDELSDFYWVELDEPEKASEMIVKLVKERIPARFGFDFMKDIQVLTPMNRGLCGTVTLNELLQSELNSGGKAQFKHGERTFKIGDRVMQTSNNYDKKVFNGDMGRISHIDMHESVFSVLYDEMTIDYEFAEADQITLAYAVTVHKAQGCEFPAVVMPLLTQHYMMLQRKLLYTAMTRAKKLLVLIGSKKAVSMAVRNVSSEPRYSMLLTRLKN